MLSLAILLLVVIVVAEWYSKLDFSLGVLYILPVLVAASVLNRWQTVVAAGVAALIRGQFIVEGLPPIEFWLRYLMAMLAYSGGGLLLGEVSRNRRAIVEAFTKLKIEKEMRQQAEEQLRLLAESSPAAILTLNQQGDVIAANRAANEMLGVQSPDTLVGKPIAAHVPVLAGALRNSRSSFVRASVAGWARKVNGMRFPVASWFSTFETAQQRCLAGIMVDMSEDMRDRELESFRHFGEYNRLLASAVSHEIRNMCLAIRVVTTNLRQKPGLVEDADFAALSTLIEGLSRMASFELQSGKDESSGWIDPTVVLEQLRVVVEPDWNDAGGQLEWNIEKLPMVRGDEHSLLQVFLNLAQNSLRAAQHSTEVSLRVHARVEDGSVVVSLIDSGPGIADPAKLFQPFRAEAGGSGLGLYISRTIMRSMGGELLFVPRVTGCRFDVKLAGGLKRVESDAEDLADEVRA